MARSVNPIADLVGKISEEIGTVTNQFETDLSSVGENFSAGKAELNKKISELSDFAATQGGPQSAFNDLGENVGTFMQGAGSAIQSLVPDSIESLQETTGSLKGAIGDITGTLDKLSVGDIAGGLQEAVGGISKAAGALDDLLSLKRGANIPSGAETFKQNSNAIDVSVNYGNDWRVRINTNWALFNSPLFQRLEDTGGMVFPYLPTVSIGSQANYNTLDPTHNNYPFYAYKNSQVNDINIQGEFTCENSRDAEYWLASNLFLRTATKMFFGQGENAGNPPVICKLSGYGTNVFNNVPVVIKDYNVNLGNDTQYVKAQKYNTWVPITSTVTVNVVPIYNRERLRSFDLTDFAKGGTLGYF